MHRATYKLFDGWIATGSTRYSTLEHVNALGEGRQLVIAVVASRCTAVPANFACAVEHSADGSLFTAKSATPEITFVVPDIDPPPGFDTSTNVYVGGGASTINLLLPFVRLSFSFTGSSSSYVYIKAYGTVRGSPDVEELETPAAPRLEPGTPAAHQHLMEELRRLSAGGQAGSVFQRGAEVLRGLSLESRAHLEDLDQKLRGLSPEARSTAIQQARALVQLSLKHGGPPEPKAAACDCPPGDVKPSASSSAPCAPCSGGEARRA